MPLGIGLLGIGVKRCDYAGAGTASRHRVASLKFSASPFQSTFRQRASLERSSRWMSETENFFTLGSMVGCRYPPRLRRQLPNVQLKAGRPKGGPYDGTPNHRHMTNTVGGGCCRTIVQAGRPKGGPYDRTPNHQYRTNAVGVDRRDRPACTNSCLQRQL